MQETKFQSMENLPLLLNDEKANTENSRKTKSEVPRAPEYEIEVYDEENSSDANDLVGSGDAHDLAGLSNGQAIIHIIKASIGTGVLTLPSALKHSGWLLGTLFIVILSLTAIYSMRLLLQISANIRLIKSKYISNLDYEKTVKLCFETASEKLQKFVWMRWVLYVSLCFAEIGFLTSYHLFVSENTKVIVDYYVNNSNYSLKLWIYQIIYFFLLLPLVFIKTLDKLSYFCQLANVFGLVSLVISLVYCFQDPIPIQKLQIAKLSDSTFLAFGMVMFSFESINLINPIESNLKDKGNILKPLGVLNVSTSIVMICYILVGFGGYWKFGDTIGSSIILSIPMTPWYYMIVKPLYISSIFISYALQSYVMFNIVWKRLKLHLVTDRHLIAGETVLRVLIPTVTMVLSVSIPHLDLFISLIGALTGSIITLIVPAICHSAMVFSYQDRFRLRLNLVVDTGIVLLGVLGALVGTYSSIINIYRAMRP